MNSRQRRKQRRKYQEIVRKFNQLHTENWNKILVGLSPAGKTNKWEESNVTITRN